MQGLISQVLKLVQDIASAPTLMTPGPALLPALDGKKEGRGVGSLSLVHATTQKSQGCFFYTHTLGWLTCPPFLPEFLPSWIRSTMLPM